MSYLILDVASAPIANAADFLADEPINAPANYKDPAKIAAYVEEKRLELLEKAALDLDLACITGIGYQLPGEEVRVLMAQTEKDEARIVREIGQLIDSGLNLVTFNGQRFDLPLLMRRAAYLGIWQFPIINLDRYRSPHSDLWQRLTLNGAVSAHALGFYVRRHKWTDLVKPLSGADESRVHVTGQWAELEDSLRHDVTAVQRLARWIGAIPRLDVPVRALADAREQ